MPALDEELERRLKATNRPVRDPGFDAILHLKARRERAGRLRSGALAVATVVAFGVVALALSRPPRVGPAPASHPPTPPVATRPANGKIVVVRPPGQLWTVAPGNTQPGQVLTQGGVDSQPAVSPDGSFVVFARRRGGLSGGGGLFTVPIDGGPASHLLGPSWFAADPAWSPDGKRIAFTGGAPSRASGIYVMRATGPGEPRLVLAGATDLAIDAHPSWSPDGRHIVFQEGNAAVSTPTNFDLYVVDVRTGSTIDITPGTSDSETAPAWSPDGTRIAFSLRSGTGGPGLETIATIAPDGSDIRLLTDGTAVDVDPTWSPDGRLIAFARAATDGSFTTLTVSSTDDRLTSIRTIADGGDPAWQPIVTPGVSISPGAGSIPGVSGPVCHVTTLSADFGLGGLAGGSGSDRAYVFSRPSTTACNRRQAFVVVASAGAVPSLVFGPIECERRHSCEAFAAPDLDGDGHPELAVSWARGSAFDLDVFRVEVGTRVTIVPFVLQDRFGGATILQGRSSIFVLGGSARSMAGVICGPAAATLDVWSANATHGGSGPYTVDHRVYRFAGFALVPLSTRSSVIPLDQPDLLPQHGGLAFGNGGLFCGWDLHRG